MRFIDKQTLRGFKIVDRKTDINTLVPHLIEILRIKEKRDKLMIYYKYQTDISYEDLVNGMVRDKYTESEEFAIIRKAITDKTEEFEEYNAYVEACKAEAKEWIANRK